MRNHRRLGISTASTIATCEKMEKSQYLFLTQTFLSDKKVFVEDLVLCPVIFVEEWNKNKKRGGGGGEVYNMFSVGSRVRGPL